MFDDAGVFHCTFHFGIHPADDMCRCSGRSEEAVPCGVVEARIGLGDGRNIGQRFQALVVADGDRASASAGHMRLPGCGATEDRLHAAAQQVGGAARVRYVCKSRAHRDRINAKVFKDPRMAAMGSPQDLLFDTKRMFYGGFKTLVRA